MAAFPRLCLFGAGTDISYEDGALFLQYSERQKQINQLLTPTIGLRFVEAVSERVKAHLTTDEGTTQHVAIIQFSNTVELLCMIKSEKEISCDVFFMALDEAKNKWPTSKSIQETPDTHIVYVVVTAFHPVDTGSMPVFNNVLTHSIFRLCLPSV